jgi:putative hydrolase of the HAD superfamily
MAVALFDLDNTLFDRAGTYRQWALEYVRNAGLGEGDAEWLCEVDQDGSADRYSMWELAKSRFSLEESVDHLIETHKQGYRALMKPDNDVNGALQTLRNVGWRLGIVTNGSVTAQAEKVRRLGLSPLVDGVCISGEIELQTPDPRLFREVLARCGCDERTSGDIWMVGNSPVLTLRGAVILDSRRSGFAVDGNGSTTTATSRTQLRSRSLSPC